MNNDLVKQQENKIITNQQGDECSAVQNFVDGIKELKQIENNKFVAENKQAFIEHIKGLGFFLQKSINDNPTVSSKYSLYLKDPQSIINLAIESFVKDMPFSNGLTYLYQKRTDGPMHIERTPRGRVYKICKTYGCELVVDNYIDVANLIYEGEDFLIKPSDSIIGCPLYFQEEPERKINFEARMAETLDKASSKIVGAYSHYKFSFKGEDGNIIIKHSICKVDMLKILSCRGHSPSKKAWGTDFGEMCKKTAGKYHYKILLPNEPDNVGGAQAELDKQGWNPLSDCSVSFSLKANNVNNLNK